MLQGPPKFYNKQNKALRTTEQELTKLESEVAEITHPLRQKLSVFEYYKLKAVVNDVVESKQNGIIMKHNFKLEKMWLRQRPRSPDCILNLSSYTLTIEENMLCIEQRFLNWGKFTPGGKFPCCRG